MRLSLHVSEPQHQSLPALLVTAGSLSLCTPHQPDCRPATGTRDRNIAEILEIAQLSFLRPTSTNATATIGGSQPPPIPIVSQSIQEPTVSQSRSASLPSPKAPIHLSRPQKNLYSKIETTCLNQVSFSSLLCGQPCLCLPPQRPPKAPIHLRRLPTDCAMSPKRT